MKKKLLTVLLCAALALAIGVGASAVFGSYTMTYKAGTNDTVTNLPGAEQATDGTAYAVSATVPQREGYEFIDWTLDYAEAAKTSYTVNYLDVTTGAHVAEPKVDPTVLCGAEITEAAIDIEGWTLASDAEITKTMKADSGENEFNFFYEQTRPQELTYTVKYLDIDTLKPLHEDCVDFGYCGDYIHLEPEVIEDYMCIDQYIEFCLTEDGTVMYFFYFYNGRPMIG